MKHGGIHVQHSYEVHKLSVLPQKDSRTDRMDRKGTYNMPFDGRSSKEQLVRES